MKIQTLVAAATLAVAGSAVAQQSSDTYRADRPAAAANEGKAAGREAGHMTGKAARKAKDKAQHGAMPGDKMHGRMDDKMHDRMHDRMSTSGMTDMDSGRRMGAMGGGPATDLEARERQARMDEAYQNWWRQRGG